MGGVREKSLGSFAARQCEDGVTEFDIPMLRVEERVLAPLSNRKTP